MNINYIVLGLMALVAGFFTYKSYFRLGDSVPSQLPWVPIDVRKNKVYVSQTRDASMFTERARRVAIIQQASPNFSYKGFTNGVVEYYLTGIIAGISPAICPPAPNVIWNGGNASSEVCDILDGGNADTDADAVDFGNAFTNVCEV
jgi:hypothetical protein